MAKIKRAIIRSLAVSAAMLIICSLASTANATDDLTGSWSGHWQSCSTGHQGPLNATFCQLDESHYRVDFKGRFFKLFPFRYSVTLNVVAKDDEKTTLAGSSYLGRLFGTFYYQAEVVDGVFTASYSSCKDSGKFVMRQCCR